MPVVVVVVPVLVLVPSMTVAVMVIEPFDGSSLAAAMRVRVDPEGARSGLLWQEMEVRARRRPTANIRAENSPNRRNPCGTMRGGKDNTFMELPSLAPAGE